jgi:hypothetical protein
MPALLCGSGCAERGGAPAQAAAPATPAAAPAGISIWEMIQINLLYAGDKLYKQKCMNVLEAEKNPEKPLTAEELRIKKRKAQAAKILAQRVHELKIIHINSNAKSSSEEYRLHLAWSKYRLHLAWSNMFSQWNRSMPSEIASSMKLIEDQAARTLPSGINAPNEIRIARELARARYLDSLLYNAGFNQGTSTSLIPRLEGSSVGLIPRHRRM